MQNSGGGSTPNTQKRVQCTGNDRDDLAIDSVGYKCFIVRERELVGQSGVWWRSQTDFWDKSVRA